MLPVKSVGVHRFSELAGDAPLAGGPFCKLPALCWKRNLVSRQEGRRQSRCSRSRGSCKHRSRLSPFPVTTAWHQACRGIPGCLTNQTAGPLDGKRERKRLFEGTGRALLPSNRSGKRDQNRATLHRFLLDPGTAPAIVSPLSVAREMLGAQCGIRMPKAHPRGPQRGVRATAGNSS